MALGEKCKGDITFVEPEDFDSTVSFDARRICTILYHLVGNAIQHGRTENKNVEIHAEVMNGMFEMSVRDHGGGVQESKLKDLAKGELPPLDMESIDIKYFPPKFQNVGIPLCRKLTQDMGGELRLKNYKTGAKFIVTLPQKESRIREVSIYRPDDTLLKNCMADVLIALTE